MHACKREYNYFSITSHAGKTHIRNCHIIIIDKLLVLVGLMDKLHRGPDSVNAQSTICHNSCPTEYMLALNVRHTRLLKIEIAKLVLLRNPCLAQWNFLFWRFGLILTPFRVIPYHVHIIVRGNSDRPWKQVFISQLQTKNILNYWLNTLDIFYLIMKNLSLLLMSKVRFWWVFK